MNLYSLLRERTAAGRPVRVGLIGAGKFGSMVLAQARLIEGLHIVGVADLNVEKAHAALARVGWGKDRYQAKNLGEALKNGTTCVLENAAALADCEKIKCLIEATGHRRRQACGDGQRRSRRHVRPLTGSARQGPGFGRQRACGFELVSAGKGINFEPRYRYSTPDTVWSFFGWTEEEVAKGDFNPKMYNSFTDGTKAAVANGTCLDCVDDGLAFPPTGLHDLASVFRPAADGGRLARSGLVDIAASQEPDGREVFNNIRYGVFVTFKAPTEYARACFKQYGLLVDKSGWYGSMWRPFHMIGLETSISVFRRYCAAKPPDVAVNFATMRWPPPSAICKPVNCRTAKAAMRSGPTPFRHRGVWRWARCQSVWCITSGSSMRSRKTPLCASRMSSCRTISTWSSRWLRTTRAIQ